MDSVLDGEEALDYLEYGEYDLVILDIMMPKVNGFEVIKNLGIREIILQFLCLRQGIVQMIR